MIFISFLWILELNTKPQQPGAFVATYLAGYTILMDLSDLCGVLWHHCTKKQQDTYLRLSNRKWKYASQDMSSS